MQQQELAAEVAGKKKRLAAWIDEQGLAGVLLRRRENLAWLTAGMSGRPVALPSETAIASVVVLRDGSSYYFAANNEAARLAAEEFAGLGFEARVHPWHQGYSLEQVQQLVGPGRIGTDVARDGLLPVNLSPLRYELVPAEISRYRHLARQTAEAVSRVVLGLEPGVSTWEMEARACYELHRLGIEPTVLLIAADDRIRSYRHALTYGEKLKRFGMVNLCARRHGLSVSITRHVHFGRMPAELEQKFAAAAQVNARLMHATRAGNSSAECFQAAVDAYAALGFAGEEQAHAQGGPAGYLEREWVATPDGTEIVRSPQAFAWNPSIQGAKVEDTVLLHEGKLELLTATPELPVVVTEFAGGEVVSAGVVIR